MTEKGRDFRPKNTIENPYVLCAALWIQDGKVHPHQPKNIKTGYVITGRRHHNCFTTASSIIEDGKTIKQRVSLHEIDWEQGFLSSDDVFMTREAALVVAHNRKQTTKSYGKLYSEDIY